MLHFRFTYPSFKVASSVVSCASGKWKPPVNTFWCHFPYFFCITLNEKKVYLCTDYKLPGSMCKMMRKNCQMALTCLKTKHKSNFIPQSSLHQSVFQILVFFLIFLYSKTHCYELHHMRIQISHPGKQKGNNGVTLWCHQISWRGMAPLKQWRYTCFTCITLTCHQRMKQPFFKHFSSIRCTR